MWIAVKVALIRLIALIGRGVVGWFVLLGKYPSLGRDPGIVAWHNRPERRTLREGPGKSDPAGDDLAEGELPAGELRPGLKPRARMQPATLISTQSRTLDPPARRRARAGAPRYGLARFHHRRTPVELTSRFFR